MAEEILDSTLTLADGQELAYAAFGPEDGRPLLFFHGSPGHRLEWSRADLLEIWAEHGVRVIGIDRPGYGGSPWRAGVTFGDWAAMADEVADKLGLDTFSLVGFSAGGVFALAYGAANPQRLESLCLLAPLCHPEVPGALGSMRLDARMVNRFNARLPALGRPIQRTASRMGAKDERGALRLYNILMKSRADAVEMAKHPAHILQHAREASRQGPQAPVEVSSRAFRWDPGFRLADLEGTHVTLIHGLEDNLVPVTHSRMMAERLPDARVEEIPGLGHYYTPEVIDRIARLAAAPASKTRTTTEAN